MLSAVLDPRAALIENLLQRQGRSMRWLASQIGRPAQSVHNWLTGVNGPRDPGLWDRMLEALKEATPDAGVNVYRRGTRVIPVYAGLSAGTPEGGYGDVEWVEVMDWGSEFERWGRVVQGSSMEPVILPGDVVIFENRRAEPGHVVEAYKNGEAAIKVLSGSGQSAKLRPINPDFEPIDGLDWTVRGVAVMVIREEGRGQTTRFEFAHGMRHHFT